jgi:VanZ family protein
MWRRLVVFYLLGVFAVTLAPIPPDAAVQLNFTGFDKLVHALVIAGFALILHWRPGSNPGLSSAAFALLAASAVAGLIELFQQPLPYRSGDLRDFVAGVAGALAAVAVSAVVQGRRARHRTSGHVGDSAQPDSEGSP